MSDIPKRLLRQISQQSFGQEIKIDEFEFYVEWSIPKIPVDDERGHRLEDGEPMIDVIRYQGANITKIVDKYADDLYAKIHEMIK